jgi:hypothetical protein
LSSQQQRLVPRLISDPAVPGTPQPAGQGEGIFEDCTFNLLKSHESCLLGSFSTIYSLNADVAYACYGRSFKDLVKALTNSLPAILLPLPDDLLQVLHAYLEKHDAHDESDSQRLQDELLSLYETHIHDNPSRLAPFLAILRTLKPGIRGSGRLLQWWDKLALPVLNNIGEEKGLALEAKNTLLDILIYDEDDEVEKEDAMHTSEAVSENLLSVWLNKHRAGNEEFDNEARFVEGQIQLILLAFGRKRLKVGSISRGTGHVANLCLTGFFEHDQQVLRQKGKQDIGSITAL